MQRESERHGLRGNSEEYIKQCQIVIKNRKESGSFLCMQTNKLVCYCFMKAERKHETPGLETKDFIIHSKNSSPRINIMLLLVAYVLSIPWSAVKCPRYSACTFNAFITGEQAVLED